MQYIQATLIVMLCNRYQELAYILIPDNDQDHEQKPAHKYKD